MSGCPGLGEAEGLTENDTEGLILGDALAEGDFEKLALGE